MSSVCVCGKIEMKGQKEGTFSLRLLVVTAMLVGMTSKIDASESALNIRGQRHPVAPGLAFGQTLSVLGKH